MFQPPTPGRTITRRYRAVGLAVVLLGLGPFAPPALSQGSDGPIAKKDRQTLLLSDWTPPPGQTCSLIEPKSGLPAVNEVVDSASLYQAVAERWSGGDADSPRGYVLFSLMLHRDSVTGVPGRIKVIESDLPRPIQAASRALLYRWARDPGGDESSTRLRIDIGPQLRFATGAREMCRPVLANRAEVHALFEGAIEHAEVARTAAIQVLIGPEGSVEEVKVRRSSGNADFDQLARALGYRMKFHPALNDRVPVSVWVQIPISITFDGGQPVWWTGGL